MEVITISFTACKFNFDGRSCDEFDLMIYEMSDAEHGDAAFAGVASAIEERLTSRYTPLFYGVEFDRKLEFSVVFGMNMERIDSGRSMSREEENDIASWLIGHDDYKYLTIDQPDLYDIRFKCMVTELEPIRYGMLTWAMRATFTCDGPYAYRYPSSHSFELNGTHEISYFNYSSHNGYYRPVIEYSPASGGDLIIVNKSDGNREFRMESMPAAAR